MRAYRFGMDTVREGLRQDDLEKDNYDRLICIACDRPVKRRSNPDDIGSVRYCIECGVEWLEMR